MTDPSTAAPGTGAPGLLDDPGALAPEDAAARVAADLAAVAESTAHLLRTVAGMAPEDVAGPSALPGWTRAHVLAHIARNADSLVNLLETARTGIEIPQYTSLEARERGIQDGVGRPLDVHLADLGRSAERFAAAAALLPDKAWTAVLRHRTGYTFPAHELPWKRLMELEYHHVDLDAGHTPAHWPEAFVVPEFARLSAQLDATGRLPALLLVAEDTGVRTAVGTGGDGLVVEGPVRALTAWLSGRSDGDGLQVHRSGALVPDPRTALPALPPLG